MRMWSPSGMISMVKEGVPDSAIRHLTGLPSARLNVQIALPVAATMYLFESTN